MKSLAPLLLLGPLLALTTSGCMSGLDKTTHLPSAASFGYAERQAAPGTLFPTDEAVLGGANIEQILAAKVLLPKKARLVVLSFSARPTWQSWSAELSEAERNMEQGALGKLRQCPRVAEVSLLPSLMVPQRQTIPYLREAAARFQAELLLVYRTDTRVYERSRLFSMEKVKSKCVVEAILLDVRTGIVPFSAQALQEYETKRNKQEYDVYETMAKVEIRAHSLALEEVAEKMVRFLEATPES